MRKKSTRRRRAVMGRSCRRVTFVPIGSLNPNPRNPRKHSQAQIEALARSIDAFGFNAPILADRHGTIIAGHARWLAAKQLGLTHVPVIRLEHLSAAEAQAYMLADNKLTDRSEWDERLLAVHLKELSELTVDFDIEATGFEVGEIDLLIQRLDGESDSGEPDSANEVPEVEGPAVSRPGDLWRLGDHRVYCGDSRDPASYALLLEGELASAVFADAPYNVRIHGHVSGRGKTRHREFAMGSGEMSQAEYTQFLTDVLTQCAKHSRSGSIHFQCIDWRHVTEMLTAGRAAYTELINLCVWVKTNGGLGALYRSRHELVLVFKNGRTAHRNNVQLGRYKRNRTNIWTYPGINSFARKGQERNLQALHPTVKPVALVADAILDTTARKEIVLDPFVGAGTTIIAAERTGRRGGVSRSTPSSSTPPFAAGSASPGRLLTTNPAARLPKSNLRGARAMTPRRNDYAVGYGKPPKHSQFKENQSGNPKGYRKRARKNIKTILNEVFNKKIRVVEAGASRRVPICEVIITQLAAKAAKGDIAALNLLLAFKADVRSRGELPRVDIRFIRDKKGDSG